MENIRELIKCSYAYSQNIFGRNIGVAVVDTGIANHCDFDNRIIGFYDLMNNKNKYYDDNGHGTHVSCLLLKFI